MVRHIVSTALAAAMLCGAGSAAIAQQAPVVGGSTPPLVSQAEDSVLWALAERRGTADAYRSYLSAFPNGLHAATARERLARLEGGASEGGAIPAPAIRPGSDTTGSPAEAARAEAEAGLGTAATESALGLSRDDRMTIQRRLTQLGHDTHGVDGA
ncbi:MAG TPA: hypothetical protein PLL33_15450, partial [Paracoccus sp. (in: a-proteobacteria)]|nr:hypothetical protein [Paracoccus sp. (in: a-proteobacteria)]